MLLSWVAFLQKHARKPRFPLILGSAAALAHFVVVVPTDPLAIGSTLAAPRHWLRLAIATSVGSAIGCGLMAALLQLYGLPVLDWVMPQIQERPMWKSADSWADQYGLWALFFSSALPIHQLPAIAIAALSGSDIKLITAVFLGGRLVKYPILGWVTSHAPEKLSRFKSVRKVLQLQEAQGKDQAKP